MGAFLGTSLLSYNANTSSIFRGIKILHDTSNKPESSH